MDCNKSTTLMQDVNNKAMGSGELVKGNVWEFCTLQLNFL